MLFEKVLKELLASEVRIDDYSWGDFLKRVSRGSHNFELNELRKKQGTGKVPVTVRGNRASSAPEPEGKRQPTLTVTSQAGRRLADVDPELLSDVMKTVLEEVQSFVRHWELMLRE